jgi:glyoxylase-like metal-dependent hydrolase (beta-lactamase superfamily II)
MSKNLILRQLFEKESSTYTYLLADTDTREALIIDPVYETVDRDLNLIRELELNLKYVLETHIHADHVTGASEIKKKTGAPIAVSFSARAQNVDIHLHDGDQIFLGHHPIRAIATPGHTNSCMSFLCNDLLFTGDTLLIRGSGRTDFQEGSVDRLFESVREKLFKLPDQTRVFPAHDYNGMTSSTIGEEKKYNKNLNLNLSKTDFTEIMKNKKLSLPQKIQIAVPANLLTGFRLSDELAPLNSQGIREVSAQNFLSLPATIMIWDTRFHTKLLGRETLPESLNRIQQFASEADLEQALKKLNHRQEVVFVCDDGVISSKICKQCELLSSAYLKGGLQALEDDDSIT